jgi:hypothetical protein
MKRPRERLDPGVFPGASSRGDPDCAMAKRIKSLSLNRLLLLNPPLQRGENYLRASSKIKRGGKWPDRVEIFTEGHLKGKPLQNPLK